MVFEMSNRTLDFEPKGTMKANSITIIGYYIIAGLSLAGGIILYFTVLDSLSVLLICVFGGALFAVLSYFTSKTVYYWDDERIAVVQPIMKPVIFSFGELKNAAITYQSVTLDTVSGKRYVIPRTYTGINEFIAQLREKSE